MGNQYLLFKHIYSFHDQHKYYPQNTVSLHGDPAHLAVLIITVMAMALASTEDWIKPIKYYFETYLVKQNNLKKLYYKKCIKKLD